MKIISFDAIDHFNITRAFCFFFFYLKMLLHV